MVETLKIKLWGQVVGYLAWDKLHSRSIFSYEKSFIDQGVDIAPLTDSIFSPNAMLPRFGRKEREYHGLPAFIADSLPDRWGDSVFRAWAAGRHISMKSITPLDRLAYLGKRGMGALEFEPVLTDNNSASTLDIDALWQLSDKVLHDRTEDIALSESNLMMEDLYRVGTSAGGRQAKAIVAIDDEGDVRSGQVDLPPNYRYYILKFCPKDDFPFPEVEMAYYLMAMDAGINMMPSRLIEAGGRHHFLTERFDRSRDHKVFTQTLFALQPGANSYEELLSVSRKLKLPVEQQTELFRRMAFNVLAHNVDDHNKNISFLLHESESWQLAPAYDLIFSEDFSGSPLMNRHSMSVAGKTMGITTQDLLQVGKDNDIRQAEQVVEQVRSTVLRWQHYAEQAGVPQQWAERIGAVLLG